MALLRISSSANFISSFVKSYAASSSRQGRQNVEQLHASVTRRYPEAPRLELPSNVSEIVNGERSRFGPERNRDFSTSFIFHGNGLRDAQVGEPRQTDSRLDSYDCTGAVSLNGSMQTNVPKPFLASGRSTYLNMPGGQWAQDSKYLAEGMQNSHYVVYGNSMSSRIQNGLRLYSTTTNAEGHTHLTNQIKLKLILREYGITLLILHVVVTLMTLTGAYIFILSDGDVKGFIDNLMEDPPGPKNFADSILNQESNFKKAYMLCNALLFFRVVTAIGFTPLISNLLRRKGFFNRSKFIAHINKASTFPRGTN